MLARFDHLLDKLQSACGGCMFTLFSLVFAAIFGGLSYSNAQDYWASSQWSKGQGQVISGELLSQTDSEGDTSYRALVTYFYYAGDQRMTHDRVRFGDSIYSGRGSAQDTLDKYPPETAITVYYDPDDPQNAVIERTLTTGIWGFMAVGVGGVVFAILGVIFGILRPLVRIFI